MGRVLRQSSNPIEALYAAVTSIDKRLKQLSGRHPNIQIEGTNAVQDGDGAIWIDNNDNKIHYVVNGVERTISHD